MKLKQSNQNITIDNSEDTAIMEKMLKDYTIELFNTKKKNCKTIDAWKGGKSIG